MEQPILEVNELAVGFHTYRGTVQAVRDVSFKLGKGEILGIVGESACGKSVTSNAVMGILPPENSFIPHGQITFQGKNLLPYNENVMESIRGNEISMIFQDPMTSLNPVLKIGTQLMEGYMRHKKASAKEARERAVNLLEQLGIAHAAKRMEEYPHQFSGGMRQRVVIAMALICEPKILIADEPTTALDVTIQAQILDLLKEIRMKFNTSIILISHDLGIIADTCDRVAVMYAGRMIEKGTVDEIFYSPKHPYTKGLLASLPRVTDKKEEKLHTIEGQPPDLLLTQKGCSFLPRCKYAMVGCASNVPELKQLTESHFVCCHLLDKEEKEKGGAKC